MNGIILDPPIGKPAAEGGAIDQGLLAYWPLNEFGGQRVFDSTNRVNGVLDNSSTFSRSTLGSAAANVNMSTPPQLQFANTQAFTVSAWVYYTAVTTPTSYVFAYGGSSGQGYYAQFAAVGTGLYNFDYFDGTRFIRTTNTGFALVANRWYHMVFSRDNQNNQATGHRIYINGIDRSTQTSGGGAAPNSINYTGTTFRLGARGTATTGTMVGRGVFKNVAIWNRQLRREEIWQLYENPYCLLIN